MDLLTRHGRGSTGEVGNSGSGFNSQGEGGQEVPLYLSARVQPCQYGMLAQTGDSTGGCARRPGQGGAAQPHPHLGKIPRAR